MLHLVAAKEVVVKLVASSLRFLSNGTVYSRKIVPVLHLTS